MVFFHYVALIAYLLIRFSLVILDLYEAIMSLAFSEAAFMIRDVSMCFKLPRTSKLIPGLASIH